MLRLFSTAVYYCTHTHTHAHAHTHTFNGPFPGLPRSAGTRKVKPIWTLLKQETVSGSDIRRATCKSAPRSRQKNASTPPLSFLQAGCPSCRPTNSVKALKATVYDCNCWILVNAGSVQNSWENNDDNDDNKNTGNDNKLDMRHLTSVREVVQVRWVKVQCCLSVIGGVGDAAAGPSAWLYMLLCLINGHLWRECCAAVCNGW